MFLSLTYRDNDSTPTVYSIPPRRSSDGDREASIVVQPFGPDVAAAFEDDYDPATPLPEPQSGTIWMDLSMAEAEELARRLVTVVQAAKRGIFSNMGEELNRYTREKRFQDAWDALIEGNGDEP
ncbi:hypothetical protein [Mycobacterium sp.]|uniref:hypothetical protein n=1 Tax=Mycobacterium sp. TaxID=1785 RepID=UPI000CA6CC24|nr:hypothetical protein [Mycobacterium sp.]PJE02352.1 MAG: hypothetical protein CK428_29905 [Mycobacterium sp.]